MLPKPKIRLVEDGATENQQATKQRERFLPQLKVILILSLSLSSFYNFVQMTDSYPSSRNGDFSPSSNGYLNASNPSLGQSAHSTGLPPVIRKKLMGYVGFANLPNQVHRKSVRKGFQFTAMVVGSFPSLPFDDQHESLFFFLILFYVFFLRQENPAWENLPS